jgi:hypothetical protein
VITSEPADPPPIPANGLQAVQVYASGTGLTYQWYQGQRGDTSRPVGWGTDALLTLYSVPYTQYYWVRVSGACGYADSRTVGISVSPTILAQPASTSVLSGSHATLSVTATGADLHYQWRDIYGQPVGTDSPVFNTPPIAAQTRYNCHVTSGPRGLAISHSAQVSLCSGIAIRGIVPGVVDAFSGCRWLWADATLQSSDTVFWYRGARGDTSSEVTAYRNQRNLLVCPASAGSYWYRVVRAGCSGDSGVANAP